MKLKPFSAGFAGLPLDRPLIMGVVNVTPDSFSDGGEFLDAKMAIRRGQELIRDGAGVIDVGGESTRPGAAPVSVKAELARTLPVIKELAGGGAVVSIDTRKAEVMEAALDAGALIINDVSALSGPRSLAVAASSGASIILMHMQGGPSVMQDHPVYQDAPKEIHAYLLNRVTACEEAGIERRRIAIDPGIGFGKTLDHNLEILRRLDEFLDIGCPVVLGVSRKSFIGALSKNEPPRERLAGSLAAMIAGIKRGARIIRVHDAAAAIQAIKVWEAIEGGCKNWKQ